MAYLQKLPLLLALLAAVLSGLSGSFRYIPQKELLTRMVLFMILFFILGMYVKNTVLRIIEQTEIKKKEEELRKKEEEEKEKRENKQEELGQNINLVADEEDLFEPMPVSEFIRKELKQD